LGGVPHQQWSLGFVMISEAAPDDEQNVVWLTESINVNAGMLEGKASKLTISADATDRVTMCE